MGQKMTKPDYSLASRFLGAQNLKRQEIRDQSEAAASELLEAHNSVLSAMVSLLYGIGGKPFRAGNLSLPDQAHLIAMLVQGIDLTKNAILTGCYHQAANLLKQEVESLAAIEECAAGVRIEGRTPNVTALQKGLRVKYGELNKIAHPSNPEIIQALTEYVDGGDFGPTSEPEYNEVWCKSLLGLHTVVLLRLAANMDEVFEVAVGTIFDENEWQMIAHGHSILVKEGQISPHPSAADTTDK